MLIGMLRSQALRPFEAADDGTGSGSPAADPATPPPAAERAPATDPATDPAAADPPAPAADESEEEDAEPVLTAEEWQSEATKARKQAARYRTELRTAQARIAELSATPAPPDPAQAAEVRAVAAERRASIAEAASEIGVSSGMLKAIAELQAATTPEAISGAIAKLHTFQAPLSAGAHRPPTEVTTAPTIDQQIKDAEQSSDWRTSMRLKAQQLAALAK